jgi:hypothetical protein
MNRALTGIIAAAALVGSQAVAGAHDAYMQASDRASPSHGTANDMMGMPLPLVILAAVIIIGFIVAASNNNDHPSSP